MKKSTRFLCTGTGGKQVELFNYADGKINTIVKKYRIAKFEKVIFAASYMSTPPVDGILPAILRIPRIRDGGRRSDLG